MSKKKIDSAVSVDETVSVEAVSVEKVIPATVREKSTQPLVYLGPHIPGVARHAAVFANGVLPDALQKTVSERPAVCRLIVPLDEMKATMKELNEKQSAAAQIYALIAKNYN